MATYLIDYENANKDGLNGVTKLTERDRVIIFYSDKADRMTFGLHRRLNETAATIEYRKVDVGGHNALDFQLATYLGYLLAQNPEEEYCVVSNDRGFQFLVGFWKKPQYNVCLTREIAASPQAEERRQAHDQANRQRQLERNARHAEEQAEAEKEKKNPPEEPQQKNPADPVSEEPAPEPQRKLKGPQPQKALDHTVVSLLPGQSVGEAMKAITSGLSEILAEEEPAVSAPLEASETTSEPSPSEENREEGRKKTGKAQGRRRGGRNASRRTPKVNETRQKEVSGMLSGETLSEEDLVEITSYVEKYKTKQGVNNALVRRFGTQRAGELYQKIKPLLKDKKGKSETA